jgi:hypothetical protein
MVGQVHVSSVVVDHQKKLSESNATMVRDGGTVQLAGLVSMDPSFTPTITGGTGKFLGAAGAPASAWVSAGAGRKDPSLQLAAQRRGG